MQSTCYSYPILMKLEFSRQIFENYSNIKLNKNPRIWSRVVPPGQTDGAIGMTELIVAFCNFANAPKIHGGFCLQILEERDSLED
jgi:hypothetical protein